MALTTLYTRLLCDGEEESTTQTAQTEETGHHFPIAKFVYFILLTS